MDWMKLPAWFLQPGEPRHSWTFQSIVDKQRHTRSIEDCLHHMNSQGANSCSTQRLPACLSHSKSLSETRKICGLQLPLPSNTKSLDRLSFDDQFAYRPFSSTTAAFTASLHTVWSMLPLNEYVNVLSFNLTEAFDTVRHSTLMDKMALLPLRDKSYNWINELFRN